MDSPRLHTGFESCLGKIDDPILAECGANILVVGRNVHPVVDTGATANHGVGCELVSKSQTWRPVITVDRNVSLRGRGEPGNPLQLGGPETQSLQAGIATTQVNGNSATARKVAELGVVEAFGVRRAPLVS
jgi:hypothetical protein